MAWWDLKPKITNDFKELTQTYNEKYGNYNYKYDSRSIDSKFEEILKKSVGDLRNLSVLVCGVNSGYEIKVLLNLFPNTSFTGLDISTDALGKFSLEFPNISSFHASMEQLPFKDKEFDVYLNCRAIHSTDVDTRKAIIEAIRVTKGGIIISISNGYLIDNRIVNGMYNYDTKEIDSEKPFKVGEDIKQIFKENDYNLVGEFSSEAELFISFEPSI